MKKAKASKLIDTYFESLHITLWGDYDLSRTDRRAAAKEWFLKQVIQAGIVKEDEKTEAIFEPPKTCRDRWPECESGLYDPRCCRFPKSCSAEE